MSLSEFANIHEMLGVQIRLKGLVNSFFFAKYGEIGHSR